jgi:hypothetical protein
MGLFLKDDPEKEAKKQAEKEAKKAAKTLKTEPVSQFTVTPQSVTNMAGVADEKFVQMLWSVIEQYNIPGQDYFEFKQAIDAMAALPIDEKSKFLTTFTIFNSQGCKKESLLLSLEKYMKVIQKEISSFAAEFEAQRNEKVNAKLAQIEEAKRKVEELNKQILEANNFILTASQEAQQEEMKLQMTSANFNKSAEKVLSVLESDKEKINNYIA